MKIAKIKSLCNSAKRIILFNDGGVQYISEGHAIYPLYGMPELTEDNIYIIFDIPEKNRGKIHFEAKSGLPACFDMSDRSDEELELTPVGITLWYHGRELTPYISSRGVVFLNAKYLEPFSDSKNGFSLTERRFSNGAYYAAVKDGMLLAGIVLPEQVISPELGGLLSGLGERVAREAEHGVVQLSIDDEDGSDDE